MHSPINIRFCRHCLNSTLSVKSVLTCLHRTATNCSEPTVALFLGMTGFVFVPIFVSNDQYHDYLRQCSWISINCDFYRQIIIFSPLELWVWILLWFMDLFPHLCVFSCLLDSSWCSDPLCRLNQVSEDLICLEQAAGLNLICGRW